jgi:hypothetical protein
MQKHYLHLSAYPCDSCAGPVIAGSIGVRENEISKETDLSCGSRQSAATGPARARHLLPIEWEPLSVNGASPAKAAYLEAINRAELH